MRSKPALGLALALGLLLPALLLSACGSATVDPAATPTATPTATATTTATLTATPASTAMSGSEPTAAAGSVVTSTVTEDSGGASVADVVDVGTAVAERTAVPAPTAGPVQLAVEQFATDLGLANKTVLGLTTDDWINLALSGLVVLFGYLVGGKLLFSLLRRLARRTETKFDDAFLEATGGEFQGLVVLFFTRFAALRLGFLSDGLRTILDDALFALGWFLLLRIAFKLIAFAVKWYQDNLESPDERDRLDPIIVVVQRIAYVLIIIVAVSIGLSHFGINITALTAALLLGVVVIALGAKGIVNDAISGFIILIDQPFRVSDVIQIEEVNKRGIVESIGTRTTHIRTGDNRLVVVPNSTIGGSQVINYSFPDTRYRVQIEIGVAYGSDFDQVRSVIHDAVRSVDGVLPDKPVDALYREFGDSSRTMRVRWWIDNVQHEWPIIDQVSEALETALTKAGIDLPFNTENRLVRVDPETVKQFSRSPGEPGSSGEPSAPASMPDGEKME